MTMLLMINKMYFAFAPERFAAVIAALDSCKPVLAYANATRVESNGLTTSFALDGRNAVLRNQDLSLLLANAQKEKPVALFSSQSA